MIKPSLNAGPRGKAGAPGVRSAIFSIFTTFQAVGGQEVHEPDFPPARAPGHVRC